ncbi:hypothetical protein LTR84_002981 [Exophiala bonariae]|uniref:MJ1316 RNA cyclic group end recognition domain-containing protein n=1 Tax=Exophiala bonariae TaxID=1690606 RepID=A0AAV9NA91_9EURO|nr:hypothetical protein LTR84_002981 [Exophiala bonariae]
MAETRAETSEGPNPASDSIARLREIAGNHLQEIEQENEQADKDEARKIQDLERYTKRKRGKDGSMPSSNSTPTSRMRTAQDVLHRLQWDKDLDISQFKVGYLERFDGIKETPARNWITEVTEEDWIPQHRIKYFKRVSKDGNSEVVWDRDQRIDKIFGSGENGAAEDDLRSEDGGVDLRS